MPRTRDESRVEQARLLASQGKTQREAAAELGIAYRTLQSWTDIEWPMGRPRVSDEAASGRTARRRKSGK
jgi:transposase